MPIDKQSVDRLATEAVNATQTPTGFVLHPLDYEELSQHSVNHISGPFTMCIMGVQIEMDARVMRGYALVRGRGGGFCGVIKLYDKEVK